MAPRKRLTLKQKVDLIEDSLKTGFKPLMAMEQYGISKSSLYQILKDKEEILKTFHSQPCAAKSKSNRKRNFQNVEDKLFDWFEKKKNCGVMVSGPMFKVKAEEIAKNLNVDNFKASDGWLSNFKHRREKYWKFILS